MSSAVTLAILMTASLFSVEPVHAAWTSGEWTVEPSQTIQCYHAYWTSSGILSSLCEAIRIDVLANSQETNALWDFYQITVRAYNYNSSTMAVSDDSVYIIYNLVNGASGTIAVQPQGQWIWCPQPTFTLTYLELSVNLLVPCQQIDFWDNIGSTQDTSHWHSYSPTGTSIFNFYSEQGIDVSIPQGQGWAFSFHYKDETAHFHYSGTTDSCGTTCMFDMTVSITVPSGHVDPPPIGGGGCTGCKEV